MADAVAAELVLPGIQSETPVPQHIPTEKGRLGRIKDDIAHLIKKRREEKNPDQALQELANMEVQGENEMASSEEITPEAAQNLTRFYKCAEFLRHTGPQVAPVVIAAALGYLPAAFGASPEDAILYSKIGTAIGGIPLGEKIGNKMLGEWIKNDGTTKTKITIALVNAGIGAAATLGFTEGAHLFAGGRNSPELNTAVGLVDDLPSAASTAAKILGKVVKGR